MTYIIGGRYDKSIRNGQLERAKTGTLFPDIKNVAKAARSRLACYYSQFERVPVINNDRVIAHVSGKYLAKIINLSKAYRYISTLDGYIRNVHSNRRKRTIVALGIHHKQLLAIEADQREPE
jgi:hypothetical protein